MIPTIGLMIGFYIIARCLEMLGLPATGGLSFIMRIFAAVSILVAIIGIVSLVNSGGSLPDLTRR